MHARKLKAKSLSAIALWTQAVLVTIGVARELLIGFRASSKDGKLREANSLLAQRSAERIAELNLQAEKEHRIRVETEERLAKEIQSARLRSYFLGG